MRMKPPMCVEVEFKQKNAAFCFEECFANLDHITLKAKLIKIAFWSSFNKLK